MNKHLGLQTLLELFACKHELLNDKEFIKKTLIQSAEVAQATVVQDFFYQFAPFGISGTLVITESHINIHTWPEHNFVAIDFFTCNPDIKIKEACTFLKNAFLAGEHVQHNHQRGSLDIIRKLHG